MDVAQMLCSVGMPAAGALPSAPEIPMGASTASPLFRQMFDKVASAVASTGESAGARDAVPQTVTTRVPSPAVVPANGKSASLFHAGVALSGESILENDASSAAGFADVEPGWAQQREIALRQMNAESTRTLEQRTVLANKGQEPRGNVPAGDSRLLPEAELVTDAELLAAMDVSPRTKLNGETAVSDSMREFPGLENMEDNGKSAAENLPPGLVAVLDHQQVKQSLPQGVIHATQVASLPSEAASSVAQAVVPLVRDIRSEAWDNKTALIEPRPVAASGMAELFRKDVGFVPEQTATDATSAVPIDISAVSMGPVKLQEALSLPAAAMLEVTKGKTDTAVAGLSASMVSPEVAETDGKVPVGKKVAGKDFVNAVRNENTPNAGHSLPGSKPEGTGETVLRELPSGVTVQNPAQSVTMGRHAASADAQTLGAQASVNGRITLPERELHADNREENPVTVEVGKVVQKKEGFSFQDNSNLNHDSESSGKEAGVTESSVSAGSFETVIKDRAVSLSEVSPEKDLSALRENVLSQVRDKLTNQEPVGNAGKISLKLNPHELGELQITIRLEDQKMNVDISAQNSLVKEALLQNIDQLKDTLLRQNISMERFTVSTGAGQDQNSNQSFREGRQTEQHGSEGRSQQFSRYYREESPVSQVAYGETGTSSLVDMRF